MEDKFMLTELSFNNNKSASVSSLHSSPSSNSKFNSSLIKHSDPLSKSPNPLGFLLSINFIIIYIINNLNY